MSTTQTTNLGLTKATPGTGEPFSTSVVNTNLDTIDSAVGELQDSVVLNALKSAEVFVSDTQFGLRGTAADDAKFAIVAERRTRAVAYWEQPVGGGAWQNIWTIT